VGAGDEWCGEPPRLHGVLTLPGDGDGDGDGGS
jgi:hypothetical protein